MAIKFVCSCGKRLRARDDMAARRSACPRCGAPVGIPSQQPSVRGAPLGPMSPAQRVHARLVARPPERLSSTVAPSASPSDEIPSPTSFDHAEIAPEPFSGAEPPRPLSIELVRQVNHRGSGVSRRGSWSPFMSRHPRGMETRGYQCLLHPFRAWSLVFGLAVALTGFSGVLDLLLPHLLYDLRAEAAWLQWVCAACSSVPLLILGYAAGFLDCVFTSAMAGEARPIRWPGRDVALALKSASRWLICFLAGPVVPVAGGILIWIHGGDLEILDWIILAEAVLLAITYWFLLLMAVNQRDHLRALNPARVVEMIQDLGHRLVGLAFFASVVGLAHGWLASVALERLHRDVASGWFLLFLTWVSGIFFATFLFRWAGVWFYWDNLRRKARAEHHPSGNG